MKKFHRDICCWSLSTGCICLIAMFGIFGISGCVQQETQFRGVKLGKPLDSNIQKYMEVVKKKEGMSCNVVVKKYFSIVDKNNNVICKGSLGRIQGDKHECMLEIDGSYINDLCEYVRILYNDGLLTTDQTEAKASEFSKTSGIDWHLASYTLHGCPFYQLVFENKFDVPEIFHDGRQISKEDFLKMYKEKSLKGLFRFNF